MLRTKQKYQQKMEAFSEGQIDRRSFVPAYYQLAQILLREIRSGKFLPGEPLPSEYELAEAYNLSRMTVRKSLELLQDAGLIFASRGRGTFVAPPRLENLWFRVEETPGSLWQKDAKQAIRLLEARVVRASRELAATLQVPVGSSLLYIRRLYCINDRPLGYDRKYLVYRKGIPLLEAELEYMPFHEIVSQHAKVLPVENRAVISAVVTDEEESSVLQVPTGSAAFKIEQTLFGPGGQPLAFGKTVYRGDHYRLVSSGGELAWGSRATEGAENL